LAKPGCFFGQCKDGLIHDLQSERGLHALTVRVGHAEADARILARFVDLGVGGRLHFQLVGRLHEDQAMIRHRACVASKLVGVEIERARHGGGSRESQFGLSVLKVEVACKDGFALL